jgi:hypothetical protein
MDERILAQAQVLIVCPLGGERLPSARSFRQVSSCAMNAKARCLILAGIAVSVTAASEPRVSLTQSPLVMRLSKDEFRIAFGINGERCSARGCHGMIRYRVHWKTEDGVTRSEVKLVDYSVFARTGRSIVVDRQYFDTAEGQHRTEVVAVSVDLITCHDGAPAQTP